MKKKKLTEEKKNSILGQKALKRLGKPIKGRILIGQILTVISGILGVGPFYCLTKLGNLLFDGFKSGNMDRLAIIETGKLLIMLYCWQLSVYFISLLITHFADMKLRDILRRSIISRMAKAPLAWFTESNSGLIRKAVQDDTTTVHTIVAHGPIETINSIVSPLALLMYCFYIDWRLGIMAIVTIPFYFVLYYGVSMRGMNEKTAEMNLKLGKVSAAMVELISGLSVVKAFGKTGKAHKNYKNAATEFAVSYSNWCLPLVDVCCAALAFISIPAILLVNFAGGAFLISKGIVSLPEILTTTLIALILPQAFMSIAQILWSYQMAGSAGIRICNILDLEILPKNSKDLKPNCTDIVLNNVSFSYGKTKALDNINLNIKKKEITALIGPSGSGKTTLASLVARFNDPTFGEVKIGGVSLKDMSEETLYNTVSFVLQDSQILNVSIRDNIKLARPNASDEMMVESAKKAQIHDYIMTIPKAYDSILGTDTIFSGGQNQRLAIARAVLIDAPILILDEATAMADPESEAEIQRALSLLVKDKTVLVIAHRAAAIKGSDNIIIMENGKITDKGNHNEVYDNPYYKKLLRQSTNVEVSSEK